MAIGIVSDKDFFKEINNVDIPPKREEKSVPKPIEGLIVDVNKGRGVGNVEVPNGLRNLIGETAITDGRQQSVELARIWGVSESSASAYANGATSTSTYDDRPNSPVINSAKSRVSKRARAKLMLALSKLTDDKMDNASARDLSGIAKDMTVVMKGMEENPNGPINPNGNGPTFIFYSPTFRKEEHYETVLAKE